MQNNCDNNTVEPIDLTVVSGVTVAVTIPQVYLKDGCHLNLLFCLSKPNIVKFKDLIVGTESVVIINGVGGTGYVLEDKKANIFYADSLVLGYCYRLVWGNNGSANSAGTAGGVAHFLNLNTPCCARKYNPANTVIPTVVATATTMAKAAAKLPAAVVTTDTTTK